MRKRLINGFGNAKGGEKWGKIIIKSDADYDKAIFAARESFKRIKTAIKNNENTGWYSTLEEDDENDEKE